MNVELRIDRLVLDGISDDPGEIAAALHAELTRLITRTPGETWQKSRSHRHINGSSMQLGPSMGAVGIGNGIAQSVYSGLVSPTERGGPR